MAVFLKRWDKKIGRLESQPTLLLSSYFLHNSCKSHEGQSQDASGNQGDGGALHALGGLHQVDVLTDTCEDDQSQGKAKGNTDSIYDGFTKTEHVCHTAIIEFLGYNGQRNAENSAVVVISGRNTPRAV